MIDIRETILAQYANSPALTGIIARFNATADPRTLIESFTQNVWNHETATDWGLDIWERKQQQGFASICNQIKETNSTKAKAITAAISGRAAIGGGLTVMLYQLLHTFAPHIFRG